MAIPQLAIRVQSRSRGHSMAKALAYRHGLHLFAVRTGRSCNYLRRVERQEIAHTGLGRFDGLDRSWTLDDAQGLADRIDLGERRRNSTIARDFESALPHELDDLQQYALAQEWSDFLAARYHTPVPFAVHRPPPDGDERNLHVHALVPDRAVADDGVTMGAKLRVLSELVGRGPQEVLALRLAWQEHVNRALLEAGFDEQIDMGRTRPAGDPGLHLGPKLIGRERRRQREAGIEPDGRGVLARADKNSSEIVQRAARQVAGLRKPPAYKPSPLRERPGRRTSTAKTGVGRAAAKRFRRERPSRAQHARRAPPTYEDTSRSTFVATQRKPLRMPAVPRPKPRHDVAFLTRRTITPEMVRGRTRRRVPLTSEEASRITFTATRREPLRMPPVPRPKPRPELAYGAHRSVPPEATKERSAKRSVPANKPRRSALVLREAHERRREYWRQHYQRQRSAGRFDSRAQTRSAGASHSSSRSPRAHAPDYGAKGSRSARGTTERRRRRRRDRPTVATVARAPNYGAIGATSERGPRAKRSQASAAPGWSDAAQPYREDRPLRKRRRRLRTERTVQARQLFPPNKLLMDINHLEDRIRSGQKELAQEQERQRREKELAREQERQRREKELAQEQERQRREKELAREQERQRREKELAREQERQRREKELAREQERQRREKELAREQERQRREKELAREQERQRREKELAREQERQRREKELARESKSASDARRNSHKSKSASDARRNSHKSKSASDARRNSHESKSASDARRNSHESKSASDARRNSHESKSASDARKRPKAHGRHHQHTGFRDHSVRQANRRQPRSRRPRRHRRPSHLHRRRRRIPSSTSSRRPARRSRPRSHPTNAKSSRGPRPHLCRQRPVLRRNPAISALRGRKRTTSRPAAGPQWMKSRCARSQMERIDSMSLPSSGPSCRPPPPSAPSTTCAVTSSQSPATTITARRDHPMRMIDDGRATPGAIVNKHAPRPLREPSRNGAIPTAARRCTVRSSAL